MSDDDLTECFRHHILTTIGWPAFGSRPSAEMQMYEEGFKAGYRRCKSDNEPEFGEEGAEVEGLRLEIFHRNQELSLAARALEPFAKFEDAIDPDLPDEDEYNYEVGLNGGHTLTVGDFRRALAAFEAIEPTSDA